jgi:hypothetical protein
MVKCVYNKYRHNSNAVKPFPVVLLYLDDGGRR